MAENNNGFAEQLMLLLDAVAAEVQARTPRAEGAVTPEQLLSEDGEVRKRFLELSDRVREVTGVDLALIEWVAKAGEEPMLMIHDGGQATSAWPLWRRVA